MLHPTSRLLLCALLGSVYASCPPRCECSEAAQTVKCVSKDLRSVPTGIPGYTRNLFVTGNRIGRIGPESFRGLDNVTNLSLSNNRISEVEGDTFSRLLRLRSLDLSNNQLAVIHPQAFSVLSQSLRELNLSRALYNYSSVMDLATSLHFSSMRNLQVLDLSDNSLIYLPSRIFSRLGGLRRLQLSNNSLVAIRNLTLSGLESLEELDLTLNALKTFADEGLRELDSVPRASLLLGENPFTCNCGIEPFAQWLNGSQDRVKDAEYLVCAFPPSMRNTSILAVGTLTLECHQRDTGADLALQTSYVFLGIVLGFIGLIFLLVLYLNRKGIKKRVYDMRDACREVWEGYHYRFEIDSDPRLSQVSTSADA
ncbi:trophoblast glycoprotein a [Fundulus heteroclitus]|uniref:trophoblast glycoprotein a n=1 Tax=Fundulus heteroclitus TaxID=8078 RepID=UPI00165A9299|nr:trophoblast glycoprotein a [Fundulus heteroclitus]